MAAPRENADDETTRPCRAQPAAADDRRELLGCSPRPREPARHRRKLSPGRRHSRPIGAAGAGRVECTRSGPRIPHSPSWCARSRIWPSRSTRSSARSTTCWRLRERDDSAFKAIQASIDKLRGERDKARDEISQTFSELRRSGRSEATDRRRSGPRWRTTRPMLSFYFGRDGASCGRCRSTGPVAFAAIAATRRLREQGPQAARSARAASGDDLRYSAVRSRARATSSTAAAEAGRGRLEAGKEPDRRDQRRARPVAASLLPTAPARDQGRTTIRCLPVIATCHGWRARMR